VIRNIAERIRDGDLKEETNSRQSIGRKTSKAKVLDDGRGIGIKRTLRSIVRQCDQEMNPHAPVAKCLFESGQTNLLLFLALGWVVEQNTVAENVNLTRREQCSLGQEGRARVAERIREEEAEDETTETGEATHEHEQPKPTGPASDTTHVEDAKSEELSRSLAELIAKVEDHDTFRRFLASIPGRYCPQTARNEARLC